MVRSAILSLLLVSMAVCQASWGQDPLLDTTPSPSDILSIQDGPPAGGVVPADPSIQLQLSDDTAVIQPGTPPVTTPNTPVQPQRTSPAPNVASLGGGNYNQLTNSPVYVSPFASATGLISDSGSSLGGYFGSGAHEALLQTPEMFGDFRRPGSSYSFFDDGSYYDPENDHEEPGMGRQDFPTAGSFSGMRVSENNVALPQDRIWASYHHYNNAYALASGDIDLDRFIIGLEKTFDGGSSSVEVRLPIAGALDPVDPAGNFFFAGGSFGNLQVILKRVLYASSDRVLALGLAIEAPTGSQSHALDFTFGTAQFTYDPAAVYLTPYLGTLRVIDDIWFINSFVQFEFATGGDRLTASLNGGAPQEFLVNQPALFLFDVGGGVWLTTPNRNGTGVALTNEWHFAQALGDDDTFAVDPTNALPNVFVDFNTIRTVLNNTTGLHVQLNQKTSVRTAVSIPILEERIFDTEFMVQLNCNY